MNDLIDARTPRQEPKPMGYAPDAKPLYVRVNYGRWIVDCRACNGAELATRDDPWFWCRGCYNHREGNMLLPVVWPEDPEAIASELRPRPVENRNWDSWQEVDDLRAENIENVEVLRAERDRLSAEIKRFETA
jgi:hypothetical protein